MTVVAEKFLEHDERDHLIELHSDEDQACKEVHTLAVANFGTVLGVSCQYVVEGVLSILSRSDEGSDLAWGKGALDI